MRKRLIKDQRARNKKKSDKDSAIRQKVISKNSSNVNKDDKKDNLKVKPKKSKKAGGNSSDSQDLSSELADSIGELTPAQPSAKQKAIDEKIWSLDDDNNDGDNKNRDGSEHSEDDEFPNETDMYADSLVEGIEDYNEYRLGSIKYEKD